MDEKRDALQRIPGQQHLKRAMEVAATARLPLGIVTKAASLPTHVFDGESEVHLMPLIEQALYAMGTTCFIFDLTLYRKNPSFEPPQAVYSCVAVPPLDLPPPSVGEPLERVLRRVKEARDKFNTHDVDNAGKALLRAAERQLSLNEEGIARTLTVARAIANLANNPLIGPAHLAEAIQYRPVSRT